MDATQPVKIGQRVRAPFRSGERIGVVVGMRSNAPASMRIKQITKVIDSQPMYNKELLQLGGWMSDYYYCSLGEALLTMIPNARPHFTATEEEGGGGEESDLSTEEPSIPEEPHPSAHGSMSLTEQQQNALNAVLHNDSKLLYLHGVTGSGKSELLLQVAKRYTEQNKGVILLVPEISLALQTAHWISTRYPMEYAVLHSRLSNAERVAQWVRIVEGQVRLVIGVRSAVFAPLPNIGIIIIDEEQDGAYKSSFAPRYHARHIAMYRAARHSAQVLFSSATPSLEAWHHIRSGRIRKLFLADRIGTAQQPKIEIATMQQERKIIGSALEKAIIDTVGSGKQVILLHNRRGYGRTLMCPSCGYIQECPRCTVAMIYHQQEQKMVCHYCATADAKKSICPECQSLEITFSGFGTERVEQELNHLFPRFRVARVDTDTVRKRHALSILFSAFHNKEIDILIGTQMVAKGLNFRNVELVGIVLADSSLALPDFRAEEHTFMLLTQVAGRAGRFSQNGRVIIQTYRPDNIAIRSVCNNDLEGYYHFELGQRQELSFPPYCRIIRIVTRSTTEKNAHLLAQQIHKRLIQQDTKPTHLYGPIPCTIAKISDQYRYQLIVSDPVFETTHSAVANALRPATPPLLSQPAAYIEVDIDPTRLL